MSSTFHGLEVGKRGLVAHQAGLNVTGHNLSNRANPEYSRQKVQMSTTHPLAPPGLTRDSSTGQIGTGVHAEKISRIRDSFVDNRIIDESSYLGYWKERSFFLKQMEAIQQEPGAPSLKSRFGQFIDRWNNLANNPKEGGSRIELRDDAVGLTKHIQNLFEHLVTLRKNADGKLRAAVDSANTYAKEIAHLNKEIAKVEAYGDAPNDLMDKRDALVQKLSNLMEIRVSRSDKDEFIVYVGSEVLVQGKNYEKISVVNDINNQGMAKLHWERDGKELNIKAGEIGGLAHTRDVDIKGQIKDLNTFALNLIETVNEIHRDGFGLNFNTQTNFFKTAQVNGTVNGDVDRDGDGVYDGTSLYKVTGTRELKKDDVLGSNGTINLGPGKLGGQDVVVNYQSTDTVANVVDRINKSGADVVAYLNHKGNLTIKATKSNEKRFEDYHIRHLEDSGNFLTGFSGLLKARGEAGSFDWNKAGELSKLSGLDKSYSVAPSQDPARWIAVDEAIMREVNNIAAARGRDNNGDGIGDRITGESDGSNALRIVASLVSENERSSLDSVAKLDHEPIIMDKHSKSFNSFLDKSIEDLGAYTRTANLELQKEEAIMHHLINTRESISGVNLDEEMVALVTYQHGYNASARFISILDRMLETIIHRMGA